MTDQPSRPPAAAPDATVAPADARQPWHAPSLTQVELKVTALLSGTGNDKLSGELPVVE